MKFFLSVVAICVVLVAAFFYPPLAVLLQGVFQEALAGLVTAFFLLCVHTISALVSYAISRNYPQTEACVIFVILALAAVSAAQASYGEADVYGLIGSAAAGFLYLCATIRYGVIGTLNKIMS